MKILIADDEEIIRRILRESLLRMGHEVIECQDGREVLSHLFTGDLPSLVLLDWDMPEIDGLETCKKIRERSDLPYTHVIMITGKTSSQDVISGLRGGANDYITKPVHLPEFQARIDVAIEMIELNAVIQKQRLQLVSNAKMAVLGEMSGGLAHEINNPLAIMIGHVEILAGFPAAQSLPKDFKSTCQRVLQAGHRIATVVKGLKEYSAETDLEPFSQLTARSLFEFVSNFCASKMRSRQIDFRIQCPEQVDDFQGQKMHLCQVLLNLLENAMHAVETCKEKWIQLDYFEDESFVHLAVSDSGPGIPEEIRLKIVQPFFSTKGVGKGAGLGLSICKGIVEAHHGIFKLDQTSQMTRFVISLPRKQNQKWNKVG